MKDLERADQLVTDLEMTKLCAKAIGIALTPRVGARNMTCGDEDLLQTAEGRAYDPLNDDSQAMALAKRFRPIMDRDEVDWYVTLSPELQGQDMSLNRAIVECVANMQSFISKGAAASTDGTDSLSPREAHE